MTRPYARRILPAISIFPLLLVLGIVGIPGGILPAAAQAPATLAEAQDVNGHPGVMAEVVQCKREAGVLSIRMRLRNTGEKSESVLLSVPDDKFYVTAGSKKYFVLRDSAKVPLASPDYSATVAKGASFIWYAKFPAPPEEVKKIAFYTPFTVPFEDIPIAD
jgi:hypothetical protein